MANIKISELNNLTSVSGNDFIVFTDSGSTLVTFRMPISSLANYFSTSGSAASSSWASSSLFSISSSFGISASYAHRSSVGLFLKYSDLPNGTASYALFAPISLTSSFSLQSSQSLRSSTSSYTERAQTASLVATSSFASVSQNVNSTLTAQTSSLTITASYVNLDTSLNIPRWYGPITSSAWSGSKWGWSDPLNQGIPFIVTENNSDVLFQVSSKMISSRFATDGEMFTIEARVLPITSSALPGYYVNPTASNRPNDADDWAYTLSFLNDEIAGNRVSGRDYLFMFRKTLNQGSYICWLASKVYDNSGINTVNNLPLQAVHISSGTAVFNRGILDDLATESFSTGQKTAWLRPMSSSHKALIYSSGKIYQGTMLAPTSSLGKETAGLSANWGRIYAFPFLVTTQSLVAGFVSASFTYRSGSIASNLANIYSASFSASTSGLNVGDVAVSYLGNIPNTATHWTTSVVVQGTALSCVPIRTEKSSSKF